jgi:hypothetical protein
VESIRKAFSEADLQSNTMTRDRATNRIEIGFVNGFDAALELWMKALFPQTKDGEIAAN